MKKENILILKKRGCDFWKDDEINNISDLQNYRLFIENVELKDGKIIDIEISRGARYDYTKKTPKLKDMYKLYLHTYYTDGKGQCWGLHEIESKIFNNDYNYNSKDLLKVINEISKKQYNKIKFIELGAK